jgi:hypothetical protein
MNELGARNLRCSTFEIEASKTNRGRYRLVLTDLSAIAEIARDRRADQNKLEADQTEKETDLQTVSRSPKFVNRSNIRPRPDQISLHY